MSPDEPPVRERHGWGKDARVQRRYDAATCTPNEILTACAILIRTFIYISLRVFQVERFCRPSTTVASVTGSMAKGIGVVVDRLAASFLSSTSDSSHEATQGPRTVCLLSNRFGTL
jgi:hypothetical protein